MGINGRQLDDINKEEKEERENRWQRYIVCVSSFMASMIGGAVLVYWQIKYHPHNRELWMVPFGLVLFTTPLFVWFISLASDARCPIRDKQQQQQQLVSEPSPLGSPSLSRFPNDPER